MEAMWTGAEAYERLMGRWSRRLAPLLMELPAMAEMQRVRLLLADKADCSLTSNPKPG